MLDRIRLTYKQHRFEVIATVALCLGVTIGAIVEALRLNAVSIPAGCDPYSSQYAGYGGLGDQGPQVSAACLAASRRWLEIRQSYDMGLIRPLSQAVPFVVGIMLGAPLVAREIENGTAPLSWALAGSRRRWLAARMGAIVLLLVPLLLAVGLSADFLAAPSSPGLNVYASFSEYMARGIPLVCWGLAAFAGTVALGTLLGRTLPAVFLAVVICVLARGTWEQGMNHYVLRPFAQVLADDSVIATGAVWSEGYNNNLVVYEEIYLDGKPWSGSMEEWWMEHPMTVDANGMVISGPDPTKPWEMPYFVPFGFHGSMYWPIVALECALLFLGSLLCAGIALVRVERRRPY
jgi:hypothetical protein